MGEEWADAGWASRAAFVIGAAYWVAITGLFVLSLPLTRSLAEVLIVFGFFYVPMAYAAVARGLYVVLSRRRPRPRFLSWWLIVTGAALGVLVTVARVTVPAT